MTLRILTGITTTGTPHLGNYIGAMRPAIAASRRPDVQSFLFLADFHALIKCEDPARIQFSQREIAAAWLATGLDSQRVIFYRQSDVPEIAELNWLLTCVTAKGLMNRAHAYKAATSASAEKGDELDAGVSMGLYCYPILMAADILLFKAQSVPVGKDQVQHIEMARDIAQRFNLAYGQGTDLFVLPQARIEDIEVLPGIDGRKMSKSYGNVIPLFTGGKKAMRDAIFRIVTDSRLPGEPKSPDDSHLFSLYKAFATAPEAAAFREALEGGIGWGDAKQQLFDIVDREISPMRQRYDELMANPAEIEAQLEEGGRRAREVAADFLRELRVAVGLRPAGGAGGAIGPSKPVVAKKKTPLFKQYRDTQGLHFFKLVSGEGKTLIQSKGFDSGREAAEWISELKQNGVQAVSASVITLGEDVSVADIETHIQTDA